MEEIRGKIDTYLTAMLSSDGIVSAVCEAEVEELQTIADRLIRFAVTLNNTVEESVVWEDTHQDERLDIFP